MSLPLPDITESESTPLVRQLRDLIQQQHETIQQLREEIARLKGLKTRPLITPSPLEVPPRPPRAPGQKRPGSAKRLKTALLTMTDEVVPLADPPPGSVFKGYEDFVVQDLLIRPRVVRYRRERWRTPDGQNLVAELPADVRPDSHFGPTLIAFVIHQYHHQHVTQPLLWEQLDQLGIDISTGQLSRILTEGKDAFHQEKAELLPAGLAVSTYVQVDDTGARHQGHNGFCTHIGNELFAYFESTDSKSRQNFLEVLRGAHTDYTINDFAVAYGQRQKLAQAVIERLMTGAQRWWADTAAWQAYLSAQQVIDPRHVRIATEGVLLGNLLAHGVSPELTVLSDGAGQFDVFVHALCWLHVERPLERLVPHNEKHRQAIEQVRQGIWELYAGLKVYRETPDPLACDALGKQFDDLVAQRTDYPSIDGVLKGMAADRAQLLLVLERPEVPLHNNLSEGHIRDYVKKRKISGSTRSELGRSARDTFASLKKTCRRLGVNFWESLQDRVRGLGQIPRLADQIRQKAEETAARNAAAALPSGPVV